MTDMLAHETSERDGRGVLHGAEAGVRTGVGTRASAARRRLVADAVFLLQCACALGFGLSQFARMLDSVEGISITWMAFWAVFLAVNLGLAVRAHRVFASRISRQTIVIYLLWTVLCGANLALLLLSEAAAWNSIDSATAAIVLAGVAGTLAVARVRHLRISDPMVHAAFAVFSKSVPQLTLAWNIWREGGAGLSTVALVAGHITIGLRLWQIVLSIREGGWDRPRLALAVSESTNEASWIVATVAWLAVP